jgi:nicotinate phosphoribosyltransferase
LELPFGDLFAYYGGPASDVYFQRARDTLLGEGVDPVVTMEYFGDGAGVLCGMTQVLDILRQALKHEGEAWALDEAEPIERKDVVLRVKARYSLFGVYETAILGILASCTGWASRAREVVEAAAGIRVVSFGARHVHPLVGPIMEYAAVSGGCVGCATPLGARLAGLPGPS